MPTCEEEVALAMPGDKLTPEELIQVKLWCGGSPAHMVVHLFKFDRARNELRLLFRSAGFTNDQELWILACAFLNFLLDPKAAREQAQFELDQSRTAKASLDIKSVLAKAQKIRKAAQGQNPDGSGIGGGPK